MLELHPDNNLPMFAVKRGDLIRFLYITEVANIAMGELQVSGDALRDAEMVCCPRKGCANSIAAVFKVKQSSASTTTSAPGGAAVLTSPKPSVTKEIMDSIQELRDALEHGIPHRRITNMREILPKIGQRIVITCSTRN